MACLRSFSRKSLYPKWFCCKILSPDALHQRHVKDYHESSFPDSGLLIRRFHRHVLLDDRKKTAFGSISEGSSGLLLCRHLSSKPEESYSKIDAFENIAGEVVSEKTVEAMATNLSTPAAENFYFPGNLINGIHELTGFNWWISIVLTAFLFNGLMSPVSVRVMRRAWELKILRKATFSTENQQRKGTDGSESHVEYIIRELVLLEKSKEALWYFCALFSLDVTIYAFFMAGMLTMAKKIPEFSTSDSLIILPLMTGFLIPSTIYLSILFQMSKASGKGMEAYISGLGRGMKIQKGGILSLSFHPILPTKTVLEVNGKDVLPDVRRRSEALVKKMGM